MNQQIKIKTQTYCAYCNTPANFVWNNGIDVIPLCNEHKRQYLEIIKGSSNENH